VRLRQLEVEIPGLDPALEGLRIAHLSDFHLGVPSRGARAVERAVDWVAGRKPDLVVVTGDLLTRPRGEALLRRLVRRLPAPAYGILGNHDVGISRDPLGRPSDVANLQGLSLLRDEGVHLELRGARVWIAGLRPRGDPITGRRVDPNGLSRDDADLRILLSHYPRVLDRLEEGRFELVLAGHMHDGQICIPYPGGKVRLAHVSAPYTSGVYRSRSTAMHVSAGLGTTFVPFRFAARPEATELVLRQSSR
jgi:predicted MPP superfamily phosphohydrolase